MKKLHFALGLAVAIAFVAPEWALALPDPNLKGGDGYGTTAPATDVNNASHGPNTTQLTERWPAGSISPGYGMGGEAGWLIDAPNNSNYIVDALTITGGRGGDGTSIYGNGGGGGSAALMPFNGGSRNVYVTGAVNITAGNGGNGDYLNAGGYGGSAYLTLGSNGTLQAQSLTIKGGDDGAGIYLYGASVGGGRARLSLGNLMVNQLRVESGSGSGNGGEARLVAENVSVAGSGTFIAQDGALNILVGKLNVAEKASILLEGYNQYSQVQFEEVYLGAGATFASAFSFCLADKNLLELSYGGYYYVGTLYVQQGATLTNPSWSGSYNPAGANSKIIFEEVNAHSLKGELNYTPVLNLGDDTNLDLSGSGSYNLQVNFAPEADIHHLYYQVKADHNLVLVQATGVGSSVIGLNKGYLKTEDYGLLEYNFNFSTNDDGLAFRTRGDKSTWISASSGYRLSPYSEAALAGLYTVMKSQQYLDSNIYDLARKLPPETVGVGLTLGGGSFRNHTGSHVDLDMYGANLALAYKTFNEAGQTTVGAFVEAGQGDYDTQNAVPVFGALAGDGETKFIGGGIFAHQVFSGEYEGAYAEASFRFGRVDNELDSIRGGRFNTVRGHERSGFDTDFGYLGAHGGLGYKWQPEGVDGLVDLYGKFFWTRLRNDSVTNGLGQYVHFNTIDSYHSRLGGRYTFAALTGLDAYVGAAWDHEFEGQAAGHVEGIKILNAGELKGSSAFFEGGLKFNPLDSENVSLDLGVFGQTGNERGIGGTAGLRIAF